jgi:hypothetical protein
LIFNRYGDRYFLSQLFDGNPDGRELSRSAAEREAKIAAATPAKAIVVALQ